MPNPLLHAKFHLHQFNVLPLRGEKPQNRPLPVKIDRWKDRWKKDRWKDNVENRGVRINMNKTKVMISGKRQKPMQKAAKMAVWCMQQRYW